MDNKNILEDEIEILDDIEEEAVLFNETPTTNDHTYMEDNSLKNSGEVLVGMDMGENEHSVSDALTKFNTDDNTPLMNTHKETLSEIEIEDVNAPSLEAPSLSDELDNTLMLAKQAIHPEVVSKEKPIKDESKSNKALIIFVIVIFAFLGIIVLALPYIVDFIKSLN